MTRPRVATDGGTHNGEDGSTPDSLRSLHAVERGRPANGGPGLLDRSLQGLEYVCFVAAIVLPVVYLPILAVNWVGVDRGLLLLGFATAHGFAIAVGHGYDPSADRPSN